MNDHTAILSALLLMAIYLLLLTIVQATWYLWNWHYMTRNNENAQEHKWNAKLRYKVLPWRTTEYSYPKPGGFTDFWGLDTDPAQYNVTIASSVLPSTMTQRCLKGEPVTDHPLT